MCFEWGRNLLSVADWFFTLDSVPEVNRNVISIKLASLPGGFHPGKLEYTNTDTRGACRALGDTLWRLILMDSKLEVVFDAL